jgi:hypothetical protein
MATTTAFSTTPQTPKIATADGGVIAASGTTYDASGKSTGKTSLPIESWTGNNYKYGSTDQVFVQPPTHASSYAAVEGANPTGNQTAIMAIQHFYRQKIAEIASSHLGDSQTWNETKGPAQCNKFVYDVLQATFGEAPDVFHRKWKLLQWPVPAVAADWADETKGPDWRDLDGSKPFACWQRVPTGPDGAQPGDVLATGWPPNGPDEEGHVGIVVDPVIVQSQNLSLPGPVTTRLVSAASAASWFWPDAQQNSFIKGTITLTDHGFRPVEGTDKNYGKQGLTKDSHVRRWVCY